MASHPKLLVVGIDGGTFDIIDPMIQAGRLPVLASLMGGSASARTTCTWPAHTGPGWASFAAAGLPGHHGIFQFFDTQHPAYGARIVGSRDFGCATAWDWLESAGWTQGLVNIPMSHPQRPLRGYQITWPLSNTLRYCEPPGLLGELARAGAHFKSDLATMYRGEPDYIETALDNIRARVASVTHLMRTHPVDAVVVVLTEIDRVCHHYWHYSDTAHPRYTADAPAAYVQAIARAYEAMDWAIGALMEHVDDSCSVVIVSDHGFGPGREALAIHPLLEREGLLALRPRSGVSAAGVGTGVRGGGVTGAGAQATWFSEGETDADAGVEVDWARTQLYMPVPGSYGLNVNLRGRQQQGIVHERDYDRVLDEAAVLLREVRMPSTGRAAFARVLRREEIWPGPCALRSPDLLLVPDDESLMVSSALRGPLWSWSTQTGLHRYEGMWIHRSPRMPAGRLAERVRLIDVMPTLLADVGVDVPVAPGRPLDLAGVGDAPDPADDEASDMAIVTDRLRQMGYL
jgi:predicted AlkP superfamily phosphohydrolase/phosphomutase